jgi:hypothetical protein
MVFFHDVNRTGINLGKSTDRPCRQLVRKLVRQNITTAFTAIQELFTEKEGYAQGV